MKIKIALDWTPNVIHAGMYLAKLNGYYRTDLEVEFIATDIDNYTKKPVERLTAGEAHIALGPSEHLIDYRLLKNKSIPLKAIATIMQEETSAFVTRQSSSIDRPAKLDGKTYAGYKTLLEENLLTAMIRNDGGAGKINMTTPPRLDIFDAFLKEEFDLCWVFMPWEGVIAEMEGFKLHAFHLTDYGVPYGYSPVLMIREDASVEEKQAIQTFLKAAAQGYQEAARQPEEVAKILVKGIDHHNFNDLNFITKAMQAISPSFLNAKGQWGMMQPKRWEAYTHWLLDHHLLRYENGKEVTAEEIDVKSFYTNNGLKEF